MRRRRRWTIRLLALLATLAAMAWVGLRIVLPSIVRQRLTMVLQDAGLEEVQFDLTHVSPWETHVTALKAGPDQRLGVGDLLISYSPLDVIDGRLDAINIRDGRLVISLDDPAVFGPSTLPSTAPTSAPSEPVVLPRIVLQSCTLVLKRGEDLLELPIEGTLSPRSGSPTIALRARVGDGTLTINGKAEVSPPSFNGQVKAVQLPLASLVKLLPAESGPGDLSGNLSVDGTLNLAADSISGTASLSADRIEFAGQTFLDLSSSVQFRDKKAVVSQTQLGWAGGTISASPFDLGAPLGEITMVVGVEDVNLDTVLKLVTRDGATGTGLVRGSVPLTIDWPSVRLGEGRFESKSPGTIRLGAALPAFSRVLDQASPEMARDSTQQQVKRQILEAMTDFAFDQLRADLVREEDGLLAVVFITGRGRTGVKQPLDATLNFRGFERGLNLYLQARSSVFGEGK